MVYTNTPNQNTRIMKTKQTEDGERALKENYNVKLKRSALIDKDSIVPRKGHLVVEVIQEVKMVYSPDALEDLRLYKIVKVNPEDNYKVGEYILAEERFMYLAIQKDVVFQEELKDSNDKPTHEVFWVVIPEGHFKGTHSLSEEGKEFLKKKGVK